MSANLSHISEVTELGDPEDVNKFMKEDGWQLLGVFQRAKECDGRPAAWALYVLGRGDTSRALADIGRVAEMGREDAAMALKNGAVLLKVITRKGEWGEYPRFIIGQPRTTT